MDFMEHARQEALRGRGLTFPNPIVGAVIVQGDQIVGQGFHQGGSHAEVVALTQAGGKARGASLYCTLEPCKHTGRTGPCTSAIIESGIKRVIYAVADPTPLAGGGAEILRSAGIETSYQPNASIEFDNRAWLHKARTGKPLLIAKSAVTIDGRIAASDGSSKWITSEAARGDVAQLRADVDAIVTGTGTVLADNPLLTTRGTTRSSQPERIVVGSRALPENFQIQRDHGFTQVASPKDVLALAEERGFNSLLIESGSTLLTSFLAEDLVDEWWIYLAPLLLGSGTSAVSDLGIGKLADAKRFELFSVQPIGSDVRMILKRGSDVHRYR